VVFSAWARNTTHCHGGTLKFDEKKGGYVINMDKKQLQDSPNYDIGSDFKWTREYGRKVDSYYKAPSYWE
jgi:hypothetical protein